VLTEQLGQSFIVESRPGAASNLATEAVTRFRLGGKAGTRNNAPVVDIPGAQFRFAKADKTQEKNRGPVSRATVPLRYRIQRRHGVHPSQTTAPRTGFLFDELPPSLLQPQLPYQPLKRRDV